MYNTAFAMQKILQNQLINAAPDDFIVKLWSPDEWYNESTFYDMVFNIFDWYTLITDHGGWKQVTLNPTNGHKQTIGHLH